jgi:hypothetical protein
MNIYNSKRTATSAKAFRNNVSRNTYYSKRTAVYVKTSRSCASRDEAG